MSCKNNEIQSTCLCFLSDELNLTADDLSVLQTALLERIPGVMESLGTINWLWYEPVPES